MQLIANSIRLKDYTFKNRERIKPNLLWVRAFDKIYNPKMAVEVLFLLKKDFPHATLCMIGPDKDGTLNDCKKLALELGIEKSIEFTGYLSKNRWLKKAKNFDVFINTTTIDNTPVSVIEAMALGLPVISTEVGGLSFLIKDGFSGILVPDKEANLMATAIEKLLRNPNLTDVISTNARKMVEGFDIEKVKNQWCKLLGTHV